MQSLYRFHSSNPYLCMRYMLKTIPTRSVVANSESFQMYQFHTQKEYMNTGDGFPTTHSSLDSKRTCRTYVNWGKIRWNWCYIWGISKENLLPNLHSIQMYVHHQYKMQQNCCTFNQGKTGCSQTLQQRLWRKTKFFYLEVNTSLTWKSV